MSTPIEQFYNDFRQGILAAAESNFDYIGSEFVSSVTSELIESGVINGFEEAYYKAFKAVAVDGYWFSDDGTILDLFISDFDNRVEPSSLVQSQIEKIFNKLSNFYLKTVESSLYESLEESSPGYGLSREISDRKNNISVVNFYILSDRVISDRVKDFESKREKGVTFSYHIWDMSRLHRLQESKAGREELVIDLTEFSLQGLSCLPAHVKSSTYQSYLVVMPAEILSELYERYGSRLLEQNVRSFLQARGNVNKGMRATILNDPEMFFAYNNGITATAKDVKTIVTKDGVFIESFKDLQIVNGGQTTASLFHTKRKDKVSLDSIFVQMKLSVVDDAKSEEVIPKISEYANTQNKVNAADFFSNHPYHVRMEEISRRMWAPAKKGAQRETKWFYERARGQYADAQSKLTPTEKKKFQALNPKSQMFTKTDLAKFDNVWDEHPKYVNLGAQKNFSQYAKRIGVEWVKNQHDFNDLYFKRAISRGIIFRATEKIVSAQSWYNGGYRANIVAYTLALMSFSFKDMKKVIDIEPVWINQELTVNMVAAIAQIAYIVHEDINTPPSGISNISEWCKKDYCWIRLQGKVSDVQDIIKDNKIPFKSDKEAVEERGDAKSIRKIDSGIEAQKSVFEISSQEWTKLRVVGVNQALLTKVEVDILNVAEAIPNKIPTVRQSLILMDIIDKLEKEGVSVALN
jgi:hypothetical protein